MASVGLAQIIREPLGPAFYVRPARAQWFDAEGWIVTHRRTGLWLWTGEVITLEEARGRLLRAVWRDDAMRRRSYDRISWPSSSEDARLNLILRSRKRDARVVFWAAVVILLVAGGALMAWAWRW